MILQDLHCQRTYTGLYSKVTTHFSEMKAKESETISRVQSLEEKWQSGEDKKKVLRKELEDLEKENSATKTSLDQDRRHLEQVQITMAKAYERIAYYGKGI